MPQPELRNARAPEAAALAALHVEVWRETYGTLAPPEAVAALDERRRLPHWQAALAASGPATGTLVAASGATLLGLVSFAPSTHPAFDGAPEIRHLYVRSSARGTGLGARLLSAALARIARTGAQRAALAVVAENHAARRFYAAQGGLEAAQFTDLGPLWPSHNIVVSWSLSPHATP